VTLADHLPRCAEPDGLRLVTHRGILLAAIGLATGTSQRSQRAES
jgi:hypothetical protein